MLSVQVLQGSQLKNHSFVMVLDVMFLIYITDLMDRHPPRTTQLSIEGQRFPTESAGTPADLVHISSA